MTSRIDHHTRHRHSTSVVGGDRQRDGLVGLVLAALVLLAVTAWSYWPVIVRMFKDWQGDEDYSAGQLVPLVALIFLWVERKKLKECSVTPCWWAGIILVLLAMAGRGYGLLFMFESAERYSRGSIT